MVVQVFAIHERESIQSGQDCCCCGSHCKEEVVGLMQQNISMIVSMFLFVLHCVMDIFATGKSINHRGKYGLHIPANFHFYGHEKAI